MGGVGINEIRLLVAAMTYSSYLITCKYTNLAISIEKQIIIKAKATAIRKPRSPFCAGLDTRFFLVRNCSAFIDVLNRRDKA